MHAVILRRALNEYGGDSQTHIRTHRAIRPACPHTPVKFPLIIPSFTPGETTFETRRRRMREGAETRIRMRMREADRKVERKGEWRRERSVFSPTKTFHRLCNTVTAYSVVLPLPPLPQLPTAKCHCALNANNHSVDVEKAPRPPRCQNAGLTRHSIILSCRGENRSIESISPELVKYRNLAREREREREREISHPSLSHHSRQTRYEKRNKLKKIKNKKKRSDDSILIFADR